jgi:16S rRNA (cytosine967-C5)-methyltransferase
MSARDWALAEIDRRRLPGWRSGLLRRSKPVQMPSDPREIALAEHIVIGVTKNLLHLRHLLHHHSGRALNQIDPLVAKIIVIGIQQLRFMQRVPASAAVNEAVNQAKRFGRSRAAGFVNVVLRNASRNPDPLPPDAAEYPAVYASLALSHPQELFRRLSKLVGATKALEICRHNNTEPPTIVRLLKSATREQLADSGADVKAHERPDMFVIDSPRRAVLADWARRGIAQVQDPTAAGVVEFMDILPGQRILDRCAGVGTKTLQIRDVLGESGEILAVDPSAPRLKLLKESISARGFADVVTERTAMLATVESLAPESFDRVLVDVPCSNSGVLARRPEARYAQRDGDLRSLTSLQREILADTAAYVAANGLLVLSTCSIWPEENERQVEWFVRKFPSFLVERSLLVLPSASSDPCRYHDGGFVAVLRRSRQPHS